MSDPNPRPGFFESLRTRVETPSDGALVPSALRVTTAYAWRILVIAGAVALVIWLVMQLKLLVIPILVALLITALLWPAFTWLIKRGLPRWLAIVISVLGTLVIVGGLLTLAIWQISQQASAVRDRAVEGWEMLRDWLITGPFALSPEQIDAFMKQAQETLAEQQELLLNGALAVGSTAAHIGTGAVLALFVLLCLLADGGGIWKWVVRLFPRTARAATDGSGRLGWRTVVNYARTQLLVAVIDAVGIGLSAFFLGVPLAVPIGILVFLGSFVPIVGAVVTGFVAVLIALVYNGWLIAVIMLAAVLAVQQLEGHVLQPFLMGSAVKVHPLAVVLVVAGGTMVAGIPGALFAVPLAAFINVVAVSLSSGAWRSGTLSQDQLIWRQVPTERRAR
ncbi:AI-2E family transporter [Microbacterium sp. ZW T5_56]|uniref:AI-2E family transporter n=1 Tax=Microbacterium sp. ZW T5_56 TaxID=3378081 RepID=UPI0038555629